MHVTMLHKGKSSDWMCPLLAALGCVQLLLLVKMYSHIEEPCMHYLHCFNCITEPNDSLCDPGEVFIEVKCQCESELNAFMKHLQICTLLPTRSCTINQSVNQLFSHARNT